MSSTEIQKIKNKVNTLHKKYLSMSNIFFDEKGKVIAKGKDFNTVKKETIKKIKKNLDQYQDTYIIQFNLSFLTSQVNALNLEIGNNLDQKPKGPILMETLVLRVKILSGNKVSLQDKNHCSKIRLYFLCSDISHMSSSKINKLVKIALQGNTRNRMYYYYYSELLA